MGGVVSSGQNNDDLIDNLLDADYIKTSDVERVFRAVDRAEYFLPEGRHYAYKDSAWKNGHLHLSAPCIYSEVMEGLRLQAGLSFLNLGSGTGYLSTMVGLILGSRGINHGIEYHQDVIDYANKKLEDFKKHSGAIDEFDFCEPVFKQGNCLCLSDGMCYDRIYCGAGCPEQYEPYMKNLIKIGGILVMPLNDQLLQIKRNSDNSWDVRCLLPVSFASLINPPDNVQEWVQPFDNEPPNLQSLCRSNIRNILRKIIEFEHPPVKKPMPVNKAPKKKRALRRCVVAVFESDESSDDDVADRHCNRHRRAEEPAEPALAREDFLNMVLRTIEDSARLENRMIPLRRNPRTDSNEGNKTETMDTDSNESNDESEPNNANETQVEVEVHPSKTSPQAPAEASGSSKTEENPGSSNGDKKTNNKREKFDSGLGDEIVESHYESSSENDEEMVKYHLPKVRESEGVRPVTRRWLPQISVSTSEDEREDEDLKPVSTELNMYKSPYSEHMRAKIQQLPLPQILIRYLNYYREF